ncbi:hypothetical protein DFH06DRAFT_1484951 [Mycena polygramma]|nr:hypothetical protein DFH06DRAFT_1484951 [Mycena polygramma]
MLLRGADCHTGRFKVDAGNDSCYVPVHIRRSTLRTLTSAWTWHTGDANHRDDAAGIKLQGSRTAISHSLRQCYQSQSVLGRFTAPALPGWNDDMSTAVPPTSACAPSRVRSRCCSAPSPLPRGARPRGSRSRSCRSWWIEMRVRRRSPPASSLSPCIMQSRRNAAHAGTRASAVNVAGVPPALAHDPPPTRPQSIPRATRSASLRLH